jgi:hypothetical protein
MIVHCRVAQIPARTRDARGKLLSFAEHRSRWLDERARWREFVTQCPLVGPDPRRVLRARALLTTATSALVLFVLVENLVEAKGTPFYFIWLTNWTGALTGVYAATHFLATARAFKDAETSSPQTSVEAVDVDVDPGDDTERRVSVHARAGDDVPRVARALWFCKATAPTCQFLITLMYWAILYNPAFAEPSASNVTAHGGLCAALAVDLLGAARLPVGAFDFLGAFAFMLAYLVFNVAFTLSGGTNEAGDEYVYEILAWRTHAVRAVIVVAFVAVVVLPLSFFVAWGSARLRDACFFPARRAEDRERSQPPRVDAPSEEGHGEGGEARLRV